MEIEKEQITKKNNLIILGIITFICLFIIVFNYYLYTSTKKIASNNINTQADVQLNGAAIHINSNLLAIEDLILAISEKYNSGELSDEELLAKLKKLPEEYSLLSKAGVAYEPYAYDPKEQLFAPFYTYNDNTIQSFNLEKFGDYSKDDWYVETVKNGKNWSEPYKDYSSEIYVTGFAVPIYNIPKENEKKALKGVVWVSISLSEIKKIMGKIDYAKNGYYLILSKKGYYIYHPINEIVSFHHSIYEELDTSKSKFIIKELKKAFEGLSTSAEIPSPITDQVMRIFFKPLDETGWVLCSINIDDEYSSINKILRYRLIWIAIGLLVLLSILAVFASKAYTFNKKSLWFVSTFFSLLCFVATSYIWFLTISEPLEQKNHSLIISDYVSLKRFVESYTKYSLPIYGKEPIYIPTGILIQGMEFSSPNKLNISGIIWQKYENGITENLSKGFIFPRSMKLETSEIYRRNVDNYEIIGWSFHASINEVFDCSKFPLDRPDIEVWIKHKDFDKNVVLIPDIEGYRFLVPISFPGLQEDLIVQGFTIMGSLFEFKGKVSETNYGIISKEKEMINPELFFNIIVRRQFINTLISRISLFLIIVSLLFIVLLKFSMDQNQKKGFGFTGFSVLSIIMSLLFPTFLAQFNLRAELGVSGITYMEYFYFIIYFLLLATAVIAYLFTGKITLKYIEYEDCFIPKLLYWPVIMGLLLIITLINFH